MKAVVGKSEKFSKFENSSKLGSVIGFSTFFVCNSIREQIVSSNNCNEVPVDERFADHNLKTEKSVCSTNFRTAMEPFFFKILNPIF